MAVQQMNEVEAEGLMTVDQVARCYGVTAETVRRWIRKGVMSYKLVGPYKLKRISKLEVAKYFKSVPGVEP